MTKKQFDFEISHFVRNDNQLFIVCHSESPPNKLGKI